MAVPNVSLGTLFSFKSIFKIPSPPLSLYPHLISSYHHVSPGFWNELTPPLPSELCASWPKSPQSRRPAVPEWVTLRTLCTPPCGIRCDLSFLPGAFFLPWLPSPPAFPSASLASPLPPGETQGSVLTLYVVFGRPCAHSSNFHQVQSESPAGDLQAGGLIHAL